MFCCLTGSQLYVYAVLELAKEGGGGGSTAYLHKRFILYLLK